MNNNSNNNKSIPLNYYNNIYNFLNGNYDKPQHNLNYLTSSTTQAINSLNNPLFSLTSKNPNDFININHSYPTLSHTTNTNANITPNNFININNTTLSSIPTISNPLHNNNFLPLNTYTFNSLQNPSINNPALIGINSPIYSNSNSGVVLDLINNNNLIDNNINNINNINNEKKLNSSPTFVKDNSITVNSLPPFNNSLLSSPIQTEFHSTDETNILNTINSVSLNDESNTDILDSNHYNIEEDIDYYNFLKAINNTSSKSNKEEIKINQTISQNEENINTNNTESKFLDYSYLKNIPINTANLTNNDSIYNSVSMSDSLTSSLTPNAFNPSISLNNQIPQTLNYNLLDNSFQNSTYSPLLLNSENNKANMNTTPVKENEQTLPVSSDPNYVLSNSSLALQKQNLTIDQINEMLKSIENTPIDENTKIDLPFKEVSIDSMDDLLSASHDLDYLPSEPESDNDNIDEMEKSAESMPLSDELNYITADSLQELQDQNLTIDQVFQGAEDVPISGRTRKNLSLKQFNMDSLDGMLSASLDFDYSPSDHESDNDNNDNNDSNDNNDNETEKNTESESMPLSDELTYLLTDATLGLKDQNLTIDQVLKGTEDTPVSGRTRKNLSLKQFNMDSLDGMLSASLASNVNKLNIDKESVEYRRFCMDIAHGTKNISDDDDGEYNEQRNNNTNDIDYTKSVSVQELDDLFQDFIQDQNPNEINKNTTELKNVIAKPDWFIDEQHLFSKEQVKLLKQQMLQNFQIVTQAYAIEKELRGPDSVQAGHWKNQLMEMDQCKRWSDAKKEEGLIKMESPVTKDEYMLVDNKDENSSGTTKLQGKLKTHQNDKIDEHSKNGNNSDNNNNNNDNQNENENGNQNQNQNQEEKEKGKEKGKEIENMKTPLILRKKSFFEIPGFDRLTQLFDIPYDNSSTKSRQFSRNFSRQYSKSEVIKYRTADDVDKKVKFKSIVPVQLPESIEQMIEIYSDIFDPDLIPDILRVRRGRMRFLPIEDELLLAGLKRFGDDDWFSIRAYYLPTKTRKQLKTRYKNLISRRTPESPVKDWYLEQFKPLIYLEREIMKSGTKIYKKSLRVIIRELFPHQPEFLLKRTWEELYTFGEINYSWEFDENESKKTKQEILLMGKQLKWINKQYDKSSNNKKVKVTHPCVYRLNDGNSVVFGSNADLKELDDQMAKARLQRGLPIDYDSFKVKSVKGNRLVLGNDKAVWVLPNQYIKSSKCSKNNSSKASSNSKRKLESLKNDSLKVSPSKLQKIGNDKMVSPSITKILTTDSNSPTVIPFNYPNLSTTKVIPPSLNQTNSKNKNIYIKSKNPHSHIQPKGNNNSNKNISIPKVSVVLTSTPSTKNTSVSSKIKHHMKNPNQRIVKIYNHSNRNDIKRGKITADLSTVTMNKDNAALFAPLIENVCDQVASRVMDNIIAKMISKSIDTIIDNNNKVINKNTFLNSSSSTSSSSTTSIPKASFLNQFPNHKLNPHHY